MNLLLTPLILAWALSAVGQSRIISIIQTQPNQTNTVSIADFEYVKILSARDQFPSLTARFPGSNLTISKPPARMTWSLRNAYGYGVFEVSTANNVFQNLVLPDPEKIVCAGPAEVIVTSGSWVDRSANAPVVVTLEIGPTAYPVTNSVTLGPGQGADINLESSTNLVQWTSATNGIYVADQTMFFRLRLRRIQ